MLLMVYQEQVDKKIRKRTEIVYKNSLRHMLQVYSYVSVCLECYEYAVKYDNKWTECSYSGML